MNTEKHEALIKWLQEQHDQANQNFVDNFHRDEKDRVPALLGRYVGEGLAYAHVIEHLIKERG